MNQDPLSTVATVAGNTSTAGRAAAWGLLYGLITGVDIADSATWFSTSLPGNPGSSSTQMNQVDVTTINTTNAIMANSPSTVVGVTPLGWLNVGTTIFIPNDGMDHGFGFLPVFYQSAADFKTFSTSAVGSLINFSSNDVIGSIRFTSIFPDEAQTALLSQKNRISTMERRIAALEGRAAPTQKINPYVFSPVRRNVRSTYVKCVFPKLHVKTESKSPRKSRSVVVDLEDEGVVVPSDGPIFESKDGKAYVDPDDDLTRPLRPAVSRLTIAYRPAPAAPPVSRDTSPMPKGAPKVSSLK